MMKTIAIAALLLAAPASAQDADTWCPGAVPEAPVVPQALIEAHDFHLADSANKRTALAYLYTAWNEGRLAQARLAYWAPGSFPELESGDGASDVPANVGSPHYTVHRVIEEGDQVVVLALVRGIGVGEEFTNLFGQRGVKIGDAVVEIFRFDEAGWIASKVDVIEPMSEASYDFAD